MLKIISKLEVTKIQAVKLHQKYIKDVKGATAIEYGLIAVGIALAIVATVGLVGTELDKTFKDIKKAIKN